MSIEDIAGKWAVVTGAASGMGKTTALGGGRGIRTVASPCLVPSFALVG